LEISKQTNIGVIGCGQISSIYMEAPTTFDILNIVACADIDMEKAHAQAKRFSIPKVCTVEELLADPEVEIVLNLTIPRVHSEIALAALAAGKSTYSEKPLGVTRAQGKAVLDAAQAKGLRAGCAPDTFLGGGLQTCIKLINDGQIGQPIAATAFMLNHGPESWHLAPDFYYHPGGGPMFDMGPYYFAALIAMLGPVRRVTGSAQTSFPERTITNSLEYGRKIKVTTPTHIVGVLDFANGAVGTIITSFDVWSHQLPRIEIYGTEGTLSLPDPNTFSGPVSLRRANEKEWRDVPLTHGYTKNSRGIGLADMAYAIHTNTPQRASGEMAYHVLDIMQSIHEASAEGHHIELSSTCSRPAPLLAGMRTLAENY
jgi:predicted dehydrogenase